MLRQVLLGFIFKFCVFVFLFVSVCVYVCACVYERDHGYPIMNKMYCEL